MVRNWTGRRTSGACRTQTAVAVKQVDACAVVETRLTATLVDFTVTQTTSVAGLALARVVVGSIDARTVETHHADAIIRIVFTAGTVITCRHVKYTSICKILYGAQTNL